MPVDDFRDLDATEINRFSRTAIDSRRIWVSAPRDPQVVFFRYVLGTEGDCP